MTQCETPCNTPSNTEQASVQLQKMRNVYIKREVLLSLGCAVGKANQTLTSKTYAADQSQMHALHTFSQAKDAYTNTIFSTSF